jgi:RNA polymerase sigma-70 factor (ECF subfamily)
MPPPTGHTGGKKAAPAPLRTDAPPPDFEQVFADEAAYVGRTLRYLGVHDAHVEDVCQEVFLIVHKKLAEFTGGSLRAWVRQICVHVASNHRRSARRRPEDPFAEPDSSVAATQHGDAEVRQARTRLLSALEALPEDQRVAFVLFEIEGLSMADTAEAAGCALQTAYSRLYAARNKLQAVLKGVES